MSNVGFGITENTHEGSAPKFILVSPETAIADDRRIENLETGQTDDAAAKAWIQVEVIDSVGSRVNKRYYEPRMGDMYIDTQDKFNKAIAKVNGVLTNLVRRFKGEQFVLTGATSALDFFNKVVEAIKSTPNWNEKDLRILVVNGKTTDKGTFPTLPNFAPIFEDVSVPIEKSKLKIGKNHDVKYIPYTGGDDVASDVAPDNDAPAPTGDDVEAGF